MKARVLLSRVRGGAAIGLIAVLFGLALYATIVAVLIHNSMVAAQHHRNVSDAFRTARYDIAQEESLERNYRLEPGPGVKQDYQAAADDFVTSMQAAAAAGDAGDRALASSVLASHQAYRAEINQLFATVDAGDLAFSDAIDRTADAGFEQLQAQVDQAAADHKAIAANALDKADNIQDSVLIVTPFAAVSGIILLAIFWDMLRRRTVQALRAEQETLAANERRVRALLKNAAGVVLLLDEQGSILPDQVSPATFLGHPFACLHGAPLLAHVHFSDRKRVSEAIDGIRTQSGASIRLEFRCTTAEDDPISFEAAITNLIDDPDVAALVMNCQDVTERKQVEEELLQAQKMEGIGRLAGGIAHDFNNILTAVIGYAGLALRQLPPESPAVDDLEQVISSATRAGDLTRQLLAFARKQPARPQVLNMNALIINLESLLTRMLGEDITLILSLDPDVPPVRMDMVQFEQVLVNLAVNARDAMPGGGELRIQTSCSGPDAVAGEAPVSVCMTVTDTGSGIRPETLPHIFEPFFTTKELGKGTGLGLSTSYGIVEQAGGRITVDSTPGAGATFHVYLPADRSVGSETVTEAAASGSGIIELHPHTSGRGRAASS